MNARNDHVHPVFADIVNRFAPIPCPIPDTRSPTKVVMGTSLPTVSQNLIDTYYRLPVDRLVDEARDLQARMLGAQFSNRDFALVTAMMQRLQKSPSLSGSLWLDLGVAA